MPSQGARHELTRGNDAIGTLAIPSRRRHDLLDVRDSTATRAEIGIVRIAVTGATGFIGSHVLTTLAARHDAEVVVLSRRPIANEDISQVTCDIADPPADLWDRSGRPDVLLHLAWGGLPNFRSTHHFEVELPIHYRFLTTLAKQGLPRIVSAGTCFEYGMTNGKMTEDMVVMPTNAYGFAKYALHRQLEIAIPSISLAWARLFYMYGEDQASNSLYPLLKAACRRRDAEFAMSGGEQLRDFLPVAEIARTLVALALDTIAVGVINVCSGRPRAVRALVEEWAAEEAWQPKLLLGKYPYPDWEPFAFWGDRTKLDRIMMANR